MAARVNQQQFQQEVLESSIPVLVEFYSDSCIPCTQMSPILSELEEAYAGKLKVVKVNVNFDQGLAAEYQVMASPTILFFQEGTEVRRSRGLQKMADLEDIVKELV